jgi:hypothetical protein
MQLVFILFEVQLVTDYLDIEHLERMYRDFFPKFTNKNYLLMLVPFSIIYMTVRLLMSIPVRPTNEIFGAIKKVYRHMRNHKSSIDRDSLLQDTLMHEKDLRPSSLENRDIERENKFLIIRENKDLTTIKESVEETDRKMTLVTRHNYKDMKDNSASSPADVAAFRPLIRSMKEDDPMSEDQKSSSDAEVKSKTATSLPNNTSKSKFSALIHP